MASLNHTTPYCVTIALSEPKCPKMGKRQQGSGTENLGSVGCTDKGADGRGWPSIQESWGSDLLRPRSFLTLSLWSRAPG